MFEGLLAIIEAWFTREMSHRGWEHSDYRSTSIGEETHDVHGVDAWPDLGDLRDVYSLLEQVVERIHSRD
jgi:hypothetical protein